MVRLSVIIPAYNEGERIGETLERYVRFFKKKIKSFEILVIMDSCTDNTLDIARKFAKKYPKNVKYRYYDEPLGKGGAVIKGFGLAVGDLIAYADADGATPPEQFFELENAIKDYDGVVGSRWMKGSRILKRQSVPRIIASRGFNLLVRLILGLPYKDTQCAAKVFRKKIIKEIAKEIESTDFAFDASMLYLMKKKRYRIKEVPITWSDVGYSSLKMRKAVPRMFWTLVKTRLRDTFKGKK